jgi:hypothetical protein
MGDGMAKFYFFFETQINKPLRNNSVSGFGVSEVLD